MKLLTTALCAIALSAALAIAASAPAARAQESANAKPLTVNILNAQGAIVGTATLSPAPNGVKIALDIKKLPAGAHLMHIHENAVCTPPDFKSAGAHFNPHNMNHDGSMGPMAGDIPHFELTVAENGTAHTTVIAPGVTMGSEPNSIFTNGGTSIVIHEVAKTVSDAAPPRIACAVIAKPK
jgi:superoxide dismutase, Cu-Zn family